jgi:hypothetical protein
VDVVIAVGAPERGIHGFDIESAIRHLRVAGFTGSPGFLRMSRMTAQTADTLVDADAGSIISRPDLQMGFGRMALIAQALSRVRTHSDLPVTLDDFGKRQLIHGDIQCFATIKKGERRGLHIPGM